MEKNQSLPKYWVAKLSKKYHKIYYFNTKTAEKSWKIPISNNEKSETSISKKIKKRKLAMKNKLDASERKKSPRAKRLKANDLATTSKKDELNNNVYVNPLLFNEKKEPKMIKRKTKNADVVTTKVQPSEMDVEMIDLTNEDEVVEVKDISCDEHDVRENSNFEESIILIVDTNILLSSPQMGILSVFSSKCENRKHQNITVVIPWVVLQELDGLKKSKPMAAKAISFLNRQFSKKKSCLRGQTIFEAAVVLDGFTSSNNDDDILHCCLTMQKEDANRTIILCSADKNLSNKALIHKIRCNNNLNTLNTVNKNNEVKSILSTAQKHSAKTQDPIKDEDIICVDEQISTAPMITTDDINESLHLCMGEMLKQEMIKVFGEDLWLDIVIIKPPWSLKDLFKCYKKHWLALFAQLSLPRVAQDLLEKVTSQYDAILEDSTSITKYCELAIAFLDIIQMYGKYKPVVGNEIKKLKDMRDQLKQTKTTNIANKTVSAPPPEHSSSSSEVNMDHNEDSETVANIDQVDVFWLTLDKIWSAIMCHYAIVFQSVKYIPSKSRLTDDLRQGLLNEYSNIPPRDVAARSLPLITDIVKNLLGCLERFMSSLLTEMAEALRELLHYLWMITRGFGIQSDLHRLNNVEKLRGLLITDESSQDRLKCGHSQLVNIYLAAEECAKDLNLV